MSQLRGSPNYIWSIGDVLGHGATGAVYKARHKKTGELYAVKTFNQLSQMRPAQVQMREFDVLKKLNHENIVGLLDVEVESQSGLEVIVMELCTGGSLYNLLDDPLNAFGLEEAEFLCILNDVACGMRHLHDQGIVHRDIKPGNIMRFISEDGRSIYKLIDFGAARVLLQEEQFMSLYGTEEYLFPDMYERAVLRRPSGKQFNAAVDLWSIGVTMYHIATGQLPFRPFGGRKNKDTMYKITTEKAVGVISGVQHSDNGQIEWSRQLPYTCRLSQGLKRLLTPLLAGLLECDPDLMMTFDQFFNSVRNIRSKLVVHIFSVKTCSNLSIYIDRDQHLTQFQEMIAEQTDIRSQDQQLLFENHDFNETIQAMDTVEQYPPTTPQNPIYLFCNAQQITVDASQLSARILPVMPTLSPDVQLEGDVIAAKNCCAIAHFARRIIVDLILQQQLISKAAKMFLLVLLRDLAHVRDIVTQFAMLVDEITKRINVLVSCSRLKQSLDMERSRLKVEGEGEVVNRDWEEQEEGSSWTREREEFNIIRERVVEMKTSIDLQHEQLGSVDFVAVANWLFCNGCLDEHRCVMKADILVTAFKGTLSDFQKDKQMKRLSFNEEQIHKFDKHKLKVNCAKVTSLVQDHCHPNTTKIMDLFVKWFTKVSEVQCQVNTLKSEEYDYVASKQSELTKLLDQKDTDLQNTLFASLPHVQATTSVSGGGGGGGKTETINDDVIDRNVNNHRLTRADQLVIDKLRSSLKENQEKIADITKMVNDRTSILQASIHSGRTVQNGNF